MKSRNIQYKENKWHNIESDENDKIDVLLVFTGINLVENNNILSFLSAQFKNAKIISCFLMFGLFIAIYNFYEINKTKKNPL